MIGLVNIPSYLPYLLVQLRIVSRDEVFYRFTNLVCKCEYKLRESFVRGCHYKYTKERHAGFCNWSAD